MTSNLGSHAIISNRPLGFAGSVENQAENDYAAMKERVMDNLKKAFRPEFLNRIDDIVVFHPLSAEDLQRIVTIMMKDLETRLHERGLSLALSPEALQELAAVGFDQEFGARPLRRAIQNKIEDPLADALLAGRYQPGDTVQIILDDGKNFVFTK